MYTTDAIFLICMTIAIGMVLFISTVLFLIKFGHPDDAEMTKFPKFVVISSLMLAATGVLLISLDTVSSVQKANDDLGGQLPLTMLWEALYVTIAVWLFAVIPFAFFYYEEERDEKDNMSCWNSQGCSATLYTIITFVIFMILFVIAYAFLNEAEVDMATQIQPASSMRPIADLARIQIPESAPCDLSTNCKYSENTILINVTLPVYVMAFLSFCGWFAFSLFSGVGLGTLPMDLINEYRMRPEPIGRAEWEMQKRRIGEQARSLIQTARDIKAKRDEAFDEEKGEIVLTRKQKRKGIKELRKFEKDYYFLLREHELLDEAFRLKGGNPLWYCFCLVMGIVGAFISFTWILQICIFMLPDPPAHPFLNNFFVYLSTAIPGFSFFGIVFYCLWAYYLLACCIKGNFRLGLRFLCWKIYPMEINKTMMNAFLVNCWVLLLCSVSLVQFLVYALPEYSVRTSIIFMFGLADRKSVV